MKSVAWAFFSGALSTATQSIIGNSNLIAKVYFPRESLPLATVLAQLPDLLVGWTLITCGLLVRRRTGVLLAAGGYAWFAGNFTALRCHCAHRFSR